MIHELVYPYALTLDPLSAGKGGNISLTRVHVGAVLRRVLEPSQEAPFLVHQRQALLDALPSLRSLDPRRLENTAIVVHCPDRCPIIVDYLLPHKVRAAEVAIQVGEGTELKLQVVRSWAARRALGPSADIRRRLGLDDERV